MLGDLNIQLGWYFVRLGVFATAGVTEPDAKALEINTQHLVKHASCLTLSELLKIGFFCQQSLWLAMSQP